MKNEKQIVNPLPWQYGSFSQTWVHWSVPRVWSNSQL